MSLFTSGKHTVSRELLLFNKCLIIKNNLRQKQKQKLNVYYWCYHHLPKKMVVLVKTGGNLYRCIQMLLNIYPINSCGVRIV